MDYIENYPNLIKNSTIIRLTRKKNGKTVTLLNTTLSNRVTGNIVAGIPITECVDDALDTFVFTIKPYERELFEEFDVVDFVIQSNRKLITHTMVVVSDVATMYQKNTTPVTYQHTVTLAESTKILEKFKIHNLHLTNVNDTLLRQAQKAINNAVTLVSAATYEDKCIFELSDKLVALLGNKPSEDFYFSNTDLRAVMDGILLSNNCRCEVESIQFDANGNIEKIIIGYRSLSAVTEVTPIWKRSHHGTIVNEELKNSAQDFAGKLYAKGANTICPGTITVIDTFKSSGQSSTSENLKVMLPFPISEQGFKSFYITHWYSIPASGHSIYIRQLNIASYFIETTRYATLSENDKKRYIPFDIGAKEIDLSLSYKGYSLINTVMETIVDEHSSIQMVTNVTTWSAPITYTYYPQLTIYTEVSKPGVYEADRLKMGIWANQTENNLDMERNGKHLLSLIRRTGNNEQYIDVEADYYSNLLPLMSKIADTGYVVYKREVAVYDLFCKCRYYLSKDFNAVQSKAGVNRVKHMYDIPLESAECPLVIKQYMLFSKTLQGVRDNTFSSKFIYNAVKTAISQAADPGSKINYILFRSLDGDELYYPQNTENSSGEYPYTDENNRFMRPCATYGQGKALNFAATVLDNYSVDYTRDGYKFDWLGAGGYMMSYCRYVSKEQTTVGECNAFFVEFAYSCGKFEPHNNGIYGEVDYSRFVALSPIFNKTDYELANTQPFEIKYYKDRAQTPVFITSVECLPAETDFNEVIIGTAFCRDNNLVVDNSEEDKVKTLVILNSGKWYDSDDNLDGKDVTWIGPADNAFTLEEAADYVVMRKIADTGFDEVGWAIVNGRNEILIAANGKLCDLYVSLHGTLTHHEAVRFNDEPAIISASAFNGVVVGKPQNAMAVSFFDSAVKLPVKEATMQSAYAVTFGDAAVKVAVTMATAHNSFAVSFTNSAIKTPVKYAGADSIYAVAFSDEAIKRNIAYATAGSVYVVSFTSDGVKRAVTTATAYPTYAVAFSINEAVKNIKMAQEINLDI